MASAYGKAMNNSSVTLSAAGPPETVLEPVDPSLDKALDLAMESPAAQRRDAVATVVAANPTYLNGWARLGQLGRDEMEAYAAFRVGYHRGLDQLRASGWRGSGYLRWQHPSNRGFLRCLHGLARAATRIGELDEAQRCQQFLHQLDPTWPPVDLE